MFFSSPTSNITPALTSTAMSRSDSRDSTTSYTSAFSYPQNAYSSLAMSTSPSWRTTSHPLARTDSSSTTQSSTYSVLTRRDSTSTWLPSPFKSCIHATPEEPSSYLSDDDLLFLCNNDENPLPVESIPNLEPAKKELTTEEQIAMLRELQSHESLHREERRKVVRFAAEGHGSQHKSRRPSTLRRRSTAAKRGVSSLNGPQ